jgi:hypothetical protein
VKLFWLLEAGEGGWWGYLVFGTAYQLLVVSLMLRRFNTVMHR